jgi:heme/copper-type cytochrome/quinol oxidase subunit 2
MPDQGMMLSFMYLAYLVVGTVFFIAVSVVMLWLFLTTLRRRGASPRLLGQEFVWTLVPALVLVGLTVLGEISHGWVKIAEGPRAAEIQSRLIR